MRGTWGNRLGLSIFGESHGPAVGMVVSGLPAGLPVDEEDIARDMARRAPGGSDLSTPRQEADRVRLLSGVTEGMTNGAPVCGVIENANTKSRDYEDMKRLMRPGHADYPAFRKYHGYADVRGGGHFSGRLTAPLVFAGALARQALGRLGIEAAAHIQQIGAVRDADFYPVSIHAEGLRILRESPFPLVAPEKEPAMREAILAAKAEGDSIGGAIECAAVGLPVGLGEPFFGSVESVLSSLLFSIPAVKSVAFGAGRHFAEMRGSQANDAYRYERREVRATSNHNGGVLGGLTNGMPLILSVAVKPTPSIGIQQETVDTQAKRDATIEVGGRHDPCIVPRAVPVVEAAVLIGLLELSLQEGIL